MTPTFLMRNLPKRSKKEFLQLEELLEQSDIVSIHVVLNQETEGMFSEELLHKMKKERISSTPLEEKL